MERTTAKRNILTVILAVFMIAAVSFASAYESHAVSYTISTSTAKTFMSTNNTADQVKVTIEDSLSAFNVYCKHQDAYDSMDVRLMPYDSGDPAYQKTPEDSTTNPMAAGASWNVRYDLRDDQIPNGKYWIFIYKYDPDDQKSKYLPYMRGPIIKITDGSVSLMTYSGVKSNNASIDKTVTSTTAFKKKDMSDMKYLLFQDGYTDGTTYYKTISDDIVANVTGDYAKAKAIYAWVARNFYYDYMHTNALAFDDPYKNLQFLKNGTGNGDTAIKGNVALRCDGYAGVYCALVRAQGIPCRIIEGKHVEPGKDSNTGDNKNWSTGSTSHTWTEVYANGRWMIVDPCSGSYNSYTKDGRFLKSPQVMYEYFDMTTDALCLSHSAEKVGGVWKTVAKVAKPTVKKVSAKNVKVSWTKVANATKYEIWYSSAKTSGYKKLKVTDAVSSANVFMKQNWWYKVRGYTFQNGTRINGAYSDPVRFKLTLAKPAAPVVKKASKKTVKVTWKKVANADHYEIWYSKKKASGYKKIKVVGNVKTATVNGIRNTNVYYKIRPYAFIGGKRVNGPYSAPKAFKLK